MDRRDFLKAAGLVALGPAWPAAAQDASGTLVNDIHSQLNPTRVRGIVDVDSVTALQDAVRTAAAERAERLRGRRASRDGRPAVRRGRDVAGHAPLFEGARAGRRERASSRSEAGIMWPALVEELLRRQAGSTRQWGIAQKQTGADRLTLGARWRPMSTGAA